MTYAAEPYSTAKGFCQGAFLMMSNPARQQIESDATFALSFHHLIGFAVELYLKAYLIKNGLSGKSLSFKPYGHSLTKLLDKAKEMGFECSSGDSLVNYLKPHERYEYRYLNSKMRYELWPIDSVFRLLSSLDAYVDKCVGASALFGQECGKGWQFPKELSVWR